MTFEEWFDTYPSPGRYEKDNPRQLAKDSWNAAIAQAQTLVAESFDECEPWITPGEVEGLKAE